MPPYKTAGSRKSRGHSPPRVRCAINAPDMSVSASHSKTDRRILRTQDVLGNALAALMHEKNFDDITVQIVLDRTGVGRFTLYARYRDKDDYS